jgi:hypothetical protein
MGKISKGILGGFSGKVGTIVGATWKGIDYIRSLAASVANPKTVAQLTQRSKFVLVLRFLQPLTAFLRVSFKLYATKMTQFNNAMSYNLRNAVSGTYPNYEIDFAKALVSRGNLVGAVNESATSGGDEIVITWEDNSGNGNALASDRALIAVYNISRQVSLFETQGPTREMEMASIAVPLAWAGDEVAVYLGFISADGTRVSDSIHTGTLIV